MSHRGDLAVKIDEGGSPAAAAAAKSDDKLKPPRLNASGPSPREEGRVSPRKTNSLTPRKHGPDEARTEKSTTPRKEGSQLQRKEVGSKPKGGFLASFFGDAQPSTSPVPERAESSPSAKGSKRRAGSTSMTNEQLVYIRESALAADNSMGRNSSSGIASPDVAKDSPRGKSINFMARPTATTGGSSIMKDPWKAKQVKSANAALSAELQLLQQYKLREKQYAKQTNAATPFKYLELNPEDVEILLKTPRSASSASSGSSGGTEAPAEQLKLDPTSWAKWHIEMSEKLKQRKAEAAASLVKSQRVRMYNLDSKKPGTIPKKLPSGSPTPALIPSSASGTVHKEKEKRRESESEASPSPSTDAVAPSPRVSGVGESDVARRSGRGLALKT